MKKSLAIVGDTQRINTLNRISKASLGAHPDTALSYALQAFHASEPIQYKQGMADALLNEAKINIDKGKLAAADSLLPRAIRLFEENDNLDMAGSGYLNLGISQAAANHFEAAIESYQQADKYFHQVKDTGRSGYILTLKGLAYKANGNYEKAFESWNDALNVRRKNNDHIGVLFSLSNMGILFEEVGDYKSAIDYFLQTVDYAKKNKIDWSPYDDKLAEAYAHLGQYDSALHYIRQKLIKCNIPTADSSLKKPTTADVDVMIGQMFLIQKRYAEALAKLFHWAVNRDRLDVIAYTGEAYLGMQDYDQAIKYARKLLVRAQASSSNAYTRDATTLLWKAYDRKKWVDSAYVYFRRYTAMKDSVTSYNFVRQMAAFSETRLSEKKDLQQKRENEGREILYKQKLDRESSIRKMLIISISALLLIGFIVVTNITLRRKNENLEREKLKNTLSMQQLENEKEQAKLQHRATELEMQALRSQMNPHFIFNSLNSINRFILQNNKLSASEYLTKFSKLVRLILQNSQATLISLESELESLKLYLDLEALRFDYRFGYKISIMPGLDMDMLKIPPLIIQPYVENAIWHGLMPKEEKGQLDVEVSQEQDHLFIRVSDDGVGRKQSAAYGSKNATLHKSMGLRITADRIAMVQLLSMKESSVEINDMMHHDGTPAGTEVTIKIPVLYD